MDPKPSDPASNIQTETRNGIPPAETADLETAVQDTNPLVFLGGSWALYGMLIGVSVAFSGSIGAEGRGMLCQTHNNEDADSTSVGLP